MLKHQVIEAFQTNKLLASTESAKLSIDKRLQELRVSKVIAITPLKRIFPKKRDYLQMSAVKFCVFPYYLLKVKVTSFGRAAFSYSAVQPPFWNLTRNGRFQRDILLQVIMTLFLVVREDVCY